VYHNPPARAIAAWLTSLVYWVRIGAARGVFGGRL
jgi:hypothetical protein